MISFLGPRKKSDGINKLVRVQLPPRIRSLKTLNELIKKIFYDCEIKITPHVLTFREKPSVLAKAVSGFFYASLVLSSKHYDILVLELTDYFKKISVDGLSEFNLPVNRLVVKKN